MIKKAAIILNGDVYNGCINDNYIICVDGGYRICKEKNIVPDIIIGDLDSIDKDYDTNIKVVKFDKYKNETDGELAINYAVDTGIKHVNIYGADGGRLDHVLGNFALVAMASTKGLKAILKTNYGDVYYANSTFELNTKINDTISIVPFTESVHIISTEGLEWNLFDKEVQKTSTLGISNVAVQENVKINIIKGSAWIFHIPN